MQLPQSVREKLTVVHLPDELLGEEPDELQFAVQGSRRQL
jgi:hypothetical protein